MAYFPVFSIGLSVGVVVSLLWHELTWRRALPLAVFGIEGALFFVITANILQLSFFGRYSLLYALMGAITFSLMFAWMFSKSEESTWHHQTVSALVTTFIGLAFLVNILNIRGMLIHNGLLLYLINLLVFLEGLGSVQLLIFLIIGGFAFAVRERLRELYAWVEAVVGSLICSLYVSQAVKHFRLHIKDPQVLANRGSQNLVNLAFDFIALLSGIYVTVRGFDNFDKFLKNKATKRKPGEAESLVEKTWNAVFGK